MRESEAFLPEKIALLDGYIILAALGDRVICDEKTGEINMLKRILYDVSLRNHSIFAHGLGPVGKDAFEKFQKLVLNLFIKFCDVEGIDFEEMECNTHWINPKKSANIIRGWED